MPTKLAKIELPRTAASLHRAFSTPNAVALRDRDMAFRRLPNHRCHYHYHDIFVQLTKFVWYIFTLQHTVTIKSIHPIWKFFLITFFFLNWITVHLICFFYTDLQKKTFSCQFLFLILISKIAQALSEYMGINSWVWTLVSTFCCIHFTLYPHKPSRTCCREMSNEVSVFIWNIQ